MRSTTARTTGVGSRETGDSSSLCFTCAHYPSNNKCNKCNELDRVLANCCHHPLLLLCLPCLEWHRLALE